MTRRRGQHHGDLRSALLTAAIDLLEVAGADDLTLRAVARHAGVTPAAPYHHFADKAALLSAVAADGFRRLGAAQEAVQADDPLDRVAALTAAYVRFAVAHRAHYAVMFAALQGSPDPPATGAEHSAASLQTAALQAFDHLAAAVAAADPGGDVADARHRALLVWAQAHGIVGVVDVARGLDPAYDIEALAESAGRAARAISTSATTGLPRLGQSTPTTPDEEYAFCADPDNQVPAGSPAPHSHE